MSSKTSSKAAKDERLSRNYDRAAWFYEKSAKFYSTNQIRASKRHQLKFIKPDERVVFLGVGAGEDAIMAARAGANVTCIDISAGMLEMVQRKLDRENLTAELICESAFDHKPDELYDVVCANYFLNVFLKPTMLSMMQSASQFVKPGGKFLIADVALPQGNVFARAFNVVYLGMGMGTYWLMGMVPWHKNYDYPAHFSEFGIELESVEYFRLAKYGPVLFQSIVGRKSS